MTSRSLQGNMQGFLQGNFSLPFVLGTLSSPSPASRFWSAILLLLASISPLPALECQICNEERDGTFYNVTSRARPGKFVVCSTCVRSEKQCAICQLPVHHGYQTLEDGRILCSECRKDAVLDPAVIPGLFNEVKRETMRLFSGLGVLPDRNISVKLVNQIDIIRMMMGNPRTHSDGSYQGVTQTRRYPDGTFEHTVHLCNGLPYRRLVAVAVHEYTHAWIHENKDPQRVLDRDTEEGFCELAALQVIRQRGDAIEEQLILSNTYTRGKISVLAQIADTHQFYRVAQWIKSGLDPALESAQPDRVTQLKSNPHPPTTQSWLAGLPQPVQARAPASLRLKGLAGSPPQQFALINDTTLRQGEEARIRVGETLVRIRCDEIRRNSVQITLLDSGATRELHLSDSSTRSTSSP